MSCCSPYPSLPPPDDDDGSDKVEDVPVDGDADGLDKGVILHEKRLTRAQLSALARAGGASGGGGASKKPRVGPDGDEEQQLSD